MNAANSYKEALRYVENAKESLKKAGKKDKFYIDDKYVKTACGTAYSGILVALDFLFEHKNIQKKKGRKSIEYYQSNLANMNKKLLNYLNDGYEILHLYGYYDGGKNINLIKTGMDDAVSIISALKPYSSNGVK
ncbi:MAG: hypothetical protein A2X61_13110 [Ignavibacteria bacterium GWB2_35_12]|nr:MAG: hypothetical protein A2X63_12000 [Ignavibacteria bacterium GWA2_35_8]OGU41400.1 MAG: hypothetical protein A2X61_13110 [Ignavibacteria bacterium GWB2_35_12]OGU95034.1 MAG: hypothetical protein A2220_09735 [Ignavibacteria bacterium RIFOXYA2_FULL_35_10]OGV19424.1 MAG: hypothetical protein A2475_04980 [Ignavibacteria bacterium RIFOXYC2_FULL_35_21]